MHKGIYDGALKWRTAWLERNGLTGVKWLSIQLIISCSIAIVLFDPMAAKQWCTASRFSYSFVYSRGFIVAESIPSPNPYSLKYVVTLQVTERLTRDQLSGVASPRKADVASSLLEGRRINGLLGGCVRPLNPTDESGKKDTCMN